MLIGGRSQRMGRDKASLQGPDGRSLARRVGDALRAAGAAEVLAVGGSSNPELGLPWIPDLRPGLGPLAGLETVLAQGGRWAVAACDLVGLTELTLARLQAAWIEGRPAVAWIEGRCQPLLGVYDDAQLPSLRAALDANELRAVRWVKERSPVRVDVEAELRNLNTPEDYATWLREARAKRQE